MEIGSQFKKRRSATLAVLSSSVALSCLFIPLAQARITIEPRMDVRAVFSDNVNAAPDGFRDAGIITVFEPGVGVAITSAKLEATIEYNAGIRKALFASTRGNTVNHNLLARGSAKVIDDFLYLNAGAIVTQLVRNPQGSVTLNRDTFSNNLDHVATFYVEPSIRRRLNEYVNLTVNTQVGLTILKDQPDNRPLRANVNDPLFTNVNQVNPQNFSSQPGSSSDNESASAGLQSGDAFQHYKWELKASWSRDKRRYLNELNNDYSGVANIEVPITRGFALVGSAGYEASKDIEDVIVTNQTTRYPEVLPDGTFLILRDSDSRNGTNLTGTNPQLSDGLGGLLARRDGRIIDRKGFIWDAGFHWNPSRRTDLTVRGGARFGTANISVNGFHKFSEHSSVNLSYGTNLDSLSRLLTRSINYSSGISGPTQVQVLGQRSTPVLLPLNGFDPINGGYTGNLAINNGTFLQRTARFTYTYDRPSLLTNISLFAEDRQLLSLQYLPGQKPISPNVIPNDRSIGTASTFEHHLDKTHSILVDLDFRYSEYSLETARRDYLYGGTIGYRVEFTPKIRLETKYLFSKRDTNVAGFNIKENNITVSLQAKF